MISYRVMRCRHATQLPECVLQPLAQALEAFRVTDRGMLPVRVRQHEVVDHMRETAAPHHDPEFRHVCEIGSAQSPRLPLRRKTPAPASSIAYPFRRCNVRNCPSAKRPGLIPLQCRAEQRSCFQPRVECQPLPDRFPHIVERVLRFSSDPFAAHSGSFLARKYLRAVFGSIPALAAAISCVRSGFDNLISLLIWLSVTIPPGCPVYV